MSSGKKRVRRVRVADLLKFCEENGACESGLAWLRKLPPRAFFTTAWNKCTNGYDLDWLAFGQLDVMQALHEAYNRRCVDTYRAKVPVEAVEDALRARIWG